VEENNEALALQLQEIEAGLGRELDRLLFSTTESLRFHDHELQRLASMASLEADDGKELEAKVTALTEKLIDLNREEIESRLNRVYLQRLAEKATENKDKQGELEEEELEQDLKSLHIEIPDVAAMSVVQEFKSPLLQALTKQQNRRNDQERNILEDVRTVDVGSSGNGCLQEQVSISMTALCEATETSVTRLEALYSSQHAFSAYHAEFNALAQRFGNGDEAGNHGTRPCTKMISPAVKDVMSHWNVPTSESGTVEQALYSRKQKVEQDLRRCGGTIEEVFRAHVNRLPAVDERLLETDPSTDADFLKLERALRKLRESSDRIEVAGVIGKEDDGRQDRFVDRWAKNG
jgi:hypothetical protein